MKKAFLLASMMMVMAVSAQQRPQGNNQQQKDKVEHTQSNSVDRQLKKFDQYNLTTFSYHTDSLPARPFPIKWFIQLWKDRSTL